MTSKNSSTTVYELSSVQQGMVFHHLSAGHGTGVDIEQLVCELDHRIDAPALKSSFDRLIASCDQLRSYVNLDTSPPQQEVTDPTPIALSQFDWSDCNDDAEFHAKFDQFLREDREAGFDIASPPLHRATLISLPDEKNILVWTLHHLILDGRSFALALTDLFDIYDALAAGETPTEATRPDRGQWVDWLGQHNWSPSLTYWRDVLADTHSSTSLKPAVAETTDQPLHLLKKETEVTVSGDLAQSFRDWAAESDVTLNSLLQACWAILHARYNDVSDLVVGETRAGRAGTVPNTSEMLGTFITTVPIRFSLGDCSALEVVKNTRAQQVNVRPHEHTPLAEIQSLAELPPGVPLFESLVVFDRSTLETSIKDSRPNWSNRKFRFLECTPYPFTLYVYDERELSLKLAYDSTRLSEEQAQASLHHLLALMSGVINNPGEHWRSLPLLTEVEQDYLLETLNRTGKPVSPPRGSRAIPKYG